MNEVTRIINAIQQGDGHASEELLPLVYEELRMLAAQKLSKEPPGQTLQATALVHEVYLRLIGTDDQRWDNKGHFFSAAAEAMRRILVDNARKKKSQRRGGQLQKISLDDLNEAIEALPDNLLHLDEALKKFEKEEPQVASLVKLRYFGGLTIEQIATIQGISRRTAGRHWNYARFWLYREMVKSDEWGE